MPLSDRVLEQHSLTAGEFAGLSVGLPWFRSVPKSCIEELSIRIDDAQFNTSQLSFDGKSAEEFFVPDSEWFIQDRVLVGLPLELRPKSEHKVEIQMKLSLPNMALPNGKPIVIPSAVTKSLIAN